MKRLFFILILVLLSACSAFTSPQKSYATAMEPAVEQLSKWQNDFSEFETLLTETLDADSGITRLQMIELYNIGVDEYQITRDQYSQLGLNSLDALVGPAVGLSKDGKAILETLSAVTPVEGIQDDHQVVLDCLQARVAFADELSSSIKDLSAIDMNKAGDLIACEPFAASLEKLTTFVNENK
jgi:hypothetical protein